MDQLDPRDLSLDRTTGTQHALRATTTPDRKDGRIRHAIARGPNRCRSAAAVGTSMRRALIIACVLAKAGRARNEGRKRNEKKTSSRRAFMTRSLASSAVLISGASALTMTLLATPVLAQKKYDDGASDTEIKIGHTNPYSGNARPMARSAKRSKAYFKKVNEEGGIKGAQDHVHHLRRRLLAAQDQGDGAQAGGGGQGPVPLPDTRNAAQHHDLGRDTNTRCRSWSWQPAPPSGVTQGPSLDHGLPARLRHRVDYLCQAHPGQREIPGLPC